MRNTIFGEIIEMSVRLNDCFECVCFCKLQKRKVCDKSHIAMLLLVWHRELWPCVFWTSICCWFRHHIEDTFVLNERFWCVFSSWNLMGIFYHSVRRKREGCFGAWFFGDPRGFSYCCTLYRNLHKCRLAWKIVIGNVVVLTILFIEGYTKIWKNWKSQYFCQWDDVAIEIAWKNYFQWIQKICKKIYQHT